MRVAVTQPNFIPWLGYFDLLDQVDVWVSLDNVQLGCRSYTTRNRIKLNNGKVRWLSATLHQSSRSTLIGQQRLSKGDWPSKLCAAIETNYRDAPYSDLYRDFLRDLLMPREDEFTLSRYNERIIAGLCQSLGVSYQFHRASSLEPTLFGSPQQKIFSILDHFEVSEFLNFQSGVEAGLYDPAAFQARGIKLVKHSYRHPKYHQLGTAFEPYMSIIDLLLNEGPRSLDIVRSGSNWVVQ